MAASRILGTSSRRTTLWSPFMCYMRYRFRLQSSYRMIWTTSSILQWQDEDKLMRRVVLWYWRSPSTADGQTRPTILTIVRATSTPLILPPSHESLDVSHLRTCRCILLTSSLYFASSSQFTSSSSLFERALIAHSSHAERITYMSSSEFPGGLCGALTTLFYATTLPP